MSGSSRRGIAGPTLLCGSGHELWAGTLPLMAAASERWRVVARAGEIGYDRILFFSDAVFAIAITLLIVDLRVPDLPHVQSGQLLRHAIPQIGGFTYSFAAIGLFWLAHHGLFRHIKGLDHTLVLLNLLFLGTIAFMPYPTALLSTAGNQVAATVFYAASLTAVGVAEAAVWLYAIRIRELAMPEATPAVRRWVLLRILRTPVIFLVSIPIALISPTVAKYLWLFIFVGGFVLRRLEPAEEEPEAPAGVDLDK